MILAKPWVLRLRLAKQRAKPVPAQFPVTTIPMMIEVPEAQVRFAATAGFSLVHDETHCWLRCGAHKEPITQT